MTSKEIAKRLEEVTTRTRADGVYRNFVRPSDAQSVAEQIRDETQTIIDKQTVQLAEQSAKIYAYEAIIANSNFKAVLSRAKGDTK